jgi:branched-subunit amino acid permease
MIHAILTLPLILAVLVPIMGILYPLALMAIVSQKTEEIKIEN